MGNQRFTSIEPGGGKKTLVVVGQQLKRLVNSRQEWQQKHIEG